MLRVLVAATILLVGGAVALVTMGPESEPSRTSDAACSAHPHAPLSLLDPRFRPFPWGDEQPDLVLRETVSLELDPNETKVITFPVLRGDEHRSDIEQGVFVGFTMTSDQSGDYVRWLNFVDADENRTVYPPIIQPLGQGAAGTGWGDLSHRLRPSEPTEALLGFQNLTDCAATLQVEYGLYVSDDW